jgi:hypothetical protein
VSNSGHAWLASCVISGVSALIDDQLGAASILCGNNPRTCLLASVINSKDALDLRSQTPT